MVKLSTFDDESARNALAWKHDIYLDETPDAVAWAVKNNVTSGASSTAFGPGKPCTRGEIVTFRDMAE